MRNPLNRRFGRQLVHNPGRYLGIFVLLAATISVVSGCLVTISSIQAILDGMYEKNSVEDARFETAEPLDEDARTAVEAKGVTVFDIWSREPTTTLEGIEATVRLYVDRNEVDTPSYYEGRAPRQDDEVALDHTFASNHGIAVGDQIELDGKTFTVCGIMVLPDYTALMRTNSDFVMDAITFSVGLVSSGGFERFSDLPTSYTYALAFDDQSLSTSERTERESAIAQALADRDVTLIDLLDREQNQGISYLATDIQGDRAMFMVFLYVLVAILAFVFVILTNATIEQESSVIGTLLASGWRKGEILRHYLFLPALVGLAACIVGSVLGYTLLCSVAQGMYYGSYSLPPYHTTFDAEVFLRTAVVPYAILLGITFVGLARRLKATPLAFLRHEVSRGIHRRSLRLPLRISYVNRFRLRLLARNVPMLVTLLFGVFAGSFLLMFALSLMPFFTGYADSLADSMPAGHIYVLKAPYELQMTEHQQELRDQIAMLYEVEGRTEALMGAGATLGESAEAFGEGMSAATEGAEELRDGMGELSNGAGLLEEGAKNYDEGLDSAAAEQDSIAGEVDLATLQASYQAVLQNYVTSCLGAYQACIEAGTDPSSAAIVAAGSPDVASSQQALSQSLARLVEGAAVKGGYAGAAQALSQASSGFEELAQSIEGLDAGTAQLASGASALSGAMTELKSSYSALTGGVGEYTAGVEKLLAAASRLGLSDRADALIEDVHPVADEDANSLEAIEQAEKLCIASFQVARKMDAGMEDVKVYGIQENSRYWTDTNVSDGRIVVGVGLIDKCGLHVGSTVVLSDRFTDRSYAVTVDAANGDVSDTGIYMSQDTFNETFGKASDWFCAYASDEELNIDTDCLSYTTTPDDMRALAGQIVDSFGDMVQFFLVAAALVFFVMMYLLTKTVLDHSARSISYMKVFGYRDREIRRLYLGCITGAVAAFLLLTLPLVMWGVSAGVGAIMLSYSGNFVMTFTPQMAAEDLAIGFATYLLVALLHMRHIKRVPLALVLKTQE